MLLVFSLCPKGLLASISTEKLIYTVLAKTFILFFCRLRGLHSSLDLALFLDPQDESSRFLLARIQVHLGIDLEEVLVLSFILLLFI